MQRVGQRPVQPINVDHRCQEAQRLTGLLSTALNRAILRIVWLLFCSRLPREMVLTDASPSLEIELISEIGFLKAIGLLDGMVCHCRFARLIAVLPSELTEFLWSIWEKSEYLGTDLVR